MYAIVYSLEVQKLSCVLLKYISKHLSDAPGEGAGGNVSLPCDITKNPMFFADGGS